MPIFSLLFAGLIFHSFAEAKSPDFSKGCNDAKLTVGLSQTELNQLKNMSTVLSSAKFCAVENAQGCSLSSLEVGGIVSNLGLENGDILTGSTLGKISSLMDVLKSLDGLTKAEVQCLFFIRDGKQTMIRYTFVIAPTPR